jgi:hypothetical protein
MPKREYDFPTLLADELFGIAERLSPTTYTITESGKAATEAR